MFKILVTILILIILIIVINFFGLFGFEGFKIIQSNKKNFSNRINSQSRNSINPRNINGLNFMNKNNFVSGKDRINYLKELDNSNKIQQLELDRVSQNVLFDNKDYNQNLSIDNKDNQYYYTDMINQSNINETAFNVIYSIDPIDYSDVETGLDKCNKNCKGVCFENGYDGIATCYPPQSPSFDWGTLYKNPTFTYGYNAFGPNHLPQ